MFGFLLRADVNISVASMNRYRDKGSPCRTPLSTCISLRLHPLRHSDASYPDLPGKSGCN